MSGTYSDDAFVTAAQDWYATPQDLYVESRDLLGEPSNHGRQYRVTADNWYTHHKLVKGPDRKTHAKVVGTIRCVGGPVVVTWPNGTTYVRDAESFRAPRERASNGTSSEAVTLSEEGKARKLALLTSCGIATELAGGDC